VQTDSNVPFQSHSLLLVEFTTKFLSVNSIPILFPRNFSKVPTNCKKGTFEILYDKFTYFAEHSIHYFILNFVLLHTHGIFSKTWNLLGGNIWMSSKRWVRFLPIKCPVTEMLYDSLSPSTTFKVLSCLVILKLSGRQQFSYKHKGTRRTCSCQLCSMNTDFSLSITLLDSVLSHI